MDRLHQLSGRSPILESVPAQSRKIRPENLGPFRYEMFRVFCTSLLVFLVIAPTRGAARPRLRRRRLGVYLVAVQAARESFARSICGARCNSLQWSFPT